MKNLIKNIMTDNPVYIIANRQRIKTGNLWMPVLLINLFFLSFLIASYIFSRADIINKLPITFPDCALIGFNFLLMLVIMVILVGHHSVLNNAKREMAYDQIVMTGLSPWSWFIGSFSSLIISFGIILLCFTPAVCFLCLLGIIPPALIPGMIIAYICFYINCVLIMLLLERGVMNLFSIISIFYILGLLFFPTFVLFLNEKSVNFINNSMSVWTYLNPTIYSLDFLHKSYHAQDLIAQSETSIGGIAGFWLLFIISNLSVYTIFIIYIILGRDCHKDETNKPFWLVLTSNIHLQSKITLGNDKNYRMLRERFIEECRTFQHNNFPYIIKHEFWIRGILDLIVFGILMLIFANFFDTEFDKNHIGHYVFFFITIPFLAVLSSGVHFISTITTFLADKKHRIIGIASDLILPVGQMVILFGFFMFMGDKLSELSHTKYAQLGEYLPSIMTCTMLVITTTAIFVSINFKRALIFFISAVFLWIVGIPLLCVIYSEFIQEYDYIKYLGASSPTLMIIHYIYQKQPSPETSNQFLRLCIFIISFLATLSIALFCIRKLKPLKSKFKNVIILLSVLFLFFSIKPDVIAKSQTVPSKELFEMSDKMLDSLNPTFGLTSLLPYQGYGTLVIFTLIMALFYLYLSRLFIKYHNKKIIFIIKKIIMAIIIISVLLVIPFAIILNRPPTWKSIQLYSKVHGKFEKWSYFSTLINTPNEFELPCELQGLYQYHNGKIILLKDKNKKGTLLSRLNIGKLQQMTVNDLSGISGNVVINPYWNEAKLTLHGKIPTSIAQCAIFLKDNSLMGIFSPDRTKSHQVIVVNPVDIKKTWKEISVFQQKQAPATEACLFLIEKEDDADQFKAFFIPVKAIQQKERSGWILLSKNDSKKQSAVTKKSVISDFSIDDNYLSSKEIEGEEIMIELSYSWNLSQNFESNASVKIEAKLQGGNEWIVIARPKYKTVTEMSDTEVKAEVKKYQNNKKITTNIKSTIKNIKLDIYQKEPILKLRITHEGNGPKLTVNELYINLKYWVKNYD